MRMIVLSALAVLVLLPASASASGSCGTIPSNSKHLALTDIYATNVSCPAARRLALESFRRKLPATVSGFRCVNKSRGEAVTVICTRRHQRVRYFTGV